MAVIPPVGALRFSISHQTPLTTSDGMGGTVPGWRTVTSAIPAKIGPTRGGADVRAARVTGLATYDIVVRQYAATSAIKTGDRLKNDASGETYAVKWVGNLDERGRFLTVMAVAGEVSNG
jgi:head-tail adaptor